ncbi:unannotated protein [freshwater metagenome]|uniref:Unannotated protein n=1 Tax=freshwater metagenome TaxID=449393 RepID=A0A6J6ZY16_9ZZZZ
MCGVDGPVFTDSHEFPLVHAVDQCDSPEHLWPQLRGDLQRLLGRPETADDTNGIHGAGIAGLSGLRFSRSPERGAAAASRAAVQQRLWVQLARCQAPAKMSLNLVRPHTPLINR